jgi:thioredoxin reductase (NADPH)
METNVPGIFIAGVLAAGFDANRIFIENGKLHGDALVAAILQKRADDALGRRGVRT